MWPTCEVLSKLGQIQHSAPPPGHQSSNALHSSTFQKTSNKRSRF
jgi:hypothetical protein